MLRIQILLITAAVCAVNLIAAEPPVLRSSAPYPAAGFRPKVAFHLPNEYVPPVEVGRQRLPSGPQGFDVEIEKQRVDFVGQVQGNNLVLEKEPQNSYLPPTNDENADVDAFLRVQELPSSSRPQKFKQTPTFAEPQREHRQKEPLRPQQFGERLQPRPAPAAQSQFLTPPPPPRAVPQRKTPTQQREDFLPKEQNLDKPSQEYGAPELNYPDPRSLPQGDILGVDSEDQEDNQEAIKSLNSAIEAYNRAQATRDDDEKYEDREAAEEGPVAYANKRHRKGQYYVLGPDNTVQRVMFTTTQDEMEARNNGFTAQLKYTPVGEVRDPVFKYNNQGQLVRLFK